MSLQFNRIRIIKVNPIILFTTHIFISSNLFSFSKFSPLTLARKFLCPFFIFSHIFLQYFCDYFYIFYYRKQIRGVIPVQRVHAQCKMFSNEDEIQTTMDDANIKSCISRESMRQLYEMRTNNILCDAVIKLQDNTSFNVHRNILGSCSPFFR